MRLLAGAVLAQLLPCLFLSGLFAASAAANEPAPPSAGAYKTWLSASPGRATSVEAFETYLAEHGVGGVFETHQLLRTDTVWEDCGGQPFEVAPQSAWPHIVGTLRFIRDRIEPETGPLEIVSGYRDGELNRCAGGASRSAHRGFWALDLEPREAIDRSTLIARVCRVHRTAGRGSRIGLGFYDGLRFHIDSSSYRHWGWDFGAGTSPCKQVENVG
jgi:hypothetical protein